MLQKEDHFDPIAALHALLEQHLEVGSGASRHGGLSRHMEPPIPGHRFMPVGFPTPRWSLCLGHGQLSQARPFYAPFFLVGGGARCPASNHLGTVLDQFGLEQFRFGNVLLN